MLYVDPNEVLDMSTDNKYWIDRIISDAEKYPDDIRIISLPAENGGNIRALIPFKYLDIRPEQIQTWEEVNE